MVKDKSAETVVEEIRQLLDAFCKDHLNEEYALVCRKLLEKLSRKRPSPLLKGKMSVWASGIVRTIGWVNFLGDPSQTPHMRMIDIDKGFGISEASGNNKSMTIRKMFNIHPLDPEWSLPSRIDDNPMVWMIKVNGFILDARAAPRDIQVMAFENGLIPYIPADR